MTQPRSDGEIVESVLEGDREQFGEIVRRYHPALKRVAFSRLSDLTAAEDAVQESFLNALRYLPSYNPEFSFRTWLWTILLNQCRRQYRRSCRQATDNHSTDAQVDPVDDGSATPLAQALSEERSHVLEQTLARLSAVQADALRLRFFAQLKFQEIADTMQCSLSAAKHRVRQGLQHMSEYLTESPLWDVERLEKNHDQL